MDISTIAGLILATVSIVGSILYGSPLTYFIDVPSIGIVIGGVLAATLIKWPMEDVKLLIRYYMKSMFSSTAKPRDMIEQLQRLADIARKGSVFALEKEVVDDKFLKKAITLAADNRPPEAITSILSLEIAAMEERHAKGIDMLEGIGADGPAFGMIGTLIGLVQMLQNMADPSAIGPAMAVALLTTFYGSVIANIFSIPIASKLKQRSKQESTKMNIIVAGVLGIVAGENPRVIREKLDSFLPPDERLKEEAKE